MGDKSHRWHEFRPLPLDNNGGQITYDKAARTSCKSQGELVIEMRSGRVDNDLLVPNIDPVCVGAGEKVWCRAGCIS
ncbi:hypothetical protein ACOMHN_013618 [Nucella lapillus]